MLVNGRTGLVIPVAKDDQPTLHFSTTSSYDDVWWGHKMHGCTASVHVWRPRVPSGWFILGDTAVSGSNYPTGPAVIVRESNPAAKGPILAPPEPDGWNQIWNDSGTGGAQDGSIWQPRPKDGYVAIGSVAASGYNQPSIPSYMCVRFDKCAPSTATEKIWDDTCSTHNGDTGFWRVANVSNIFVAGTSHDSYGATAYKPVDLSA